MKPPHPPPNAQQIIDQMLTDGREEALDLIQGEFSIIDDKQRYLHWDKLRCLPRPKGFSHEQWWAGIKYAREKLYRKTIFQDANADPFRFLLPDNVMRDLHWLDQNSTGSININTDILNNHTKNTYIIRSLVEESITSSQLEGAATTWKVAREMLRQGRQPTNKSEQMIYNNFKAMMFMREHKHQSLTPELILELHRIVTEKTLDIPERAGRFRQAEDDVMVVNSDQEILHRPPPAEQLPQRLQQLCDFANNDDPKIFIHPVLKAIMLHFMLAFDHPFVDGNGRTARALFYWYMAHENYWIMEFISISQVIKIAPTQYGRAFLYTESDSNDLTYFIVHQIGVIKRAIGLLTDYLQRKTKEINGAKALLEGTQWFKGSLNYRQLALLKHALKHPRFVYRIREHQNTHGVALATARNDLVKMADQFNLLVKKKSGRSWVFESPIDLEKRIKVNSVRETKNSNAVEVV